MSRLLKKAPLVLAAVIAATTIASGGASGDVGPGINVRSAYFDGALITSAALPHYVDDGGRNMPQLLADYVDHVLVSIPLANLAPGDIIDFGYDYAFTNEMLVGASPSTARVVSASVQTRLVLANGDANTSGTAMSPWQIGAFDRTQEHHHTFSDRGAFAVPTGYSGGYVNIVGRAKLLDSPKTGEFCYARANGQNLVQRACSVLAEDELGTFGLSRLTSAPLGATPGPLTATGREGQTIRLIYTDVAGAGADVLDSRKDAEDSERASTTRLPATPTGKGGDVYPVAWTKVTAAAGDTLRIDGQIGSQFPTGTPSTCLNFVGGEIALSTVEPILASQTRSSLENSATHTRASGSNLVHTEIYSGVLTREGLFVIPQAGTYWIALYAYQLSSACANSSINISRQRSWVTVTRYFAQSAYALSAAIGTSSISSDGPGITSLSNHQLVNVTCVHSGDVFRVFSTELLQISTGKPEVLLGVTADQGSGAVDLIWNPGDSNDDGRGRWTGTSKQLYRGATTVGVFTSGNASPVTFRSTVEPVASMTGTMFAKGDPYNRITYLQYARAGIAC